MRSSKAESTAQILRAALAGDPTPEVLLAALSALRRLPPGVPRDLVRGAWARLVPHAMTFHTLRKTPDSYLDAALEGLGASRTPAATFLVHALGPNPTSQEIHEANKAFRALDPDMPYTPAGQASIRAVLQDPRYLEGVLAVLSTVGRCEGCPEGIGDSLLFVRAAIYEGGEAARAAMGPIVRRAREEGVDRDLLVKLARFAGSPAMARVLEPHSVENTKG